MAKIKQIKMMISGDELKESVINFAYFNDRIFWLRTQNIQILRVVVSDYGRLFECLFVLGSRMEIWLHF